MKMRAVVPVVAAVVLAAGCSSLPVAPATGPHIADYDQEQMAKINSAARTSGARVVWVNPPRAKDGS